MLAVTSGSDETDARLTNSEDNGLCVRACVCVCVYGRVFACVRSGIIHVMESTAYILCLTNPNTWSDEGVGCKISWTDLSILSAVPSQVHHTHITVRRQCLLRAPSIIFVLFRLACRKRLQVKSMNGHVCDILSDTYVTRTWVHLRVTSCILHGWRDYTPIHSNNHHPIRGTPNMFETSTIFCNFATSTTTTTTTTITTTLSTTITTIIVTTTPTRKLLSET